MNLRLGQKVEGYLVDGLAFKGRIIGFCKDPSEVRVETVVGHKEFAKVDTLIPTYMDTLTISRKALIAQIRNSSEDAFVSDKAARDYLLRLVQNLECVSDFEK